LRHGTGDAESQDIMTNTDDAKMKITLSQNDDDDGFVTVYCDDQEAADEDGSIDGCNWETPSDMDVAYASIMDRPTLVADLEAQGYEVDDSEYWEPDEEDMKRWAAKYEAESAREAQ
jgi:hypothetical protein